MNKAEREATYLYRHDQLGAHRDEQAERDAALGAAVRGVLGAEWSHWLDRAYMLTDDDETAQLLAAIARTLDEEGA